MSVPTHYKCRSGVYQGSDVTRHPVPDDKVSWHQPWNEYCPPFYISPSATNKPWADPVNVVTMPNVGLTTEMPSWNTLDGTIDRRSHLGLYEVVDGVPRNPFGRTGIVGRGILGRWGPNHAADPIVTRWKMEHVAGEQPRVIIDDDTRLRILQFVAIQRRDTKEWAVPGGMVDPGEVVSKTLQREFEEEALNSLEISDEDGTRMRALLHAFFAGGTLVYKGYVDDPRSTDNAWIETVAMNFHDDDGSSVGRLKLRAGDDATQVQWMDVHRNLDLYASHDRLLETVTILLSAHW